MSIVAYLAATLSLLAVGGAVQAQPTEAVAEPVGTALPTHEASAAALAKAERLLVLVDARGQFDASIAQADTLSRTAMLEAFQADEEGRAELDRIDRLFPGGREGFFVAFGALLRSKFDAAYPQFLEHNKMLHARYVGEADLDTLIAVLANADGSRRSDSEAREAAVAFRLSPAATRFFAAVPFMQSEMMRFGSNLGQQLGVQAYDEIAQDHPAIFGAN